ncbi:hypothetical protein [Planctomycetes bacterium K23_9]|uniref:Uncharacterized protein n=1 Tax=Stieleria marina TaxID=1930275 RepID=A0A517NXS8_9BACT|nr:hypothetical protein K239x_39120 [Planctomycetes bacterium K23_9]
MLFGIATIAGGFWIPDARPGEVASSLVVFSILGGGLILFGLTILLLKKLSKQYGTEATDAGLKYITKKTETSFLWGEIDKVLVGRFCPSRVSEPQTFLTIEPSGGKAFKLRSSFDGDAEIVINQILTHCDYIVRNPESYNKNTK